MMRAVIFAAFVAGISAQTCLPQPVPHTETGDELCRVLLKDFGGVYKACSDISQAAQSAGGCTQFQNIDFFTQLLVTIATDSMWLEKLMNNQITSTGDECVGVNLRTDFSQKNIQAKANIPIPSAVCPPTSGSALSQYTLQRFGLTLKALAAATGCSGGSSSYQSYGSTSPAVGKWATYVKSLNDGIAAVQTIINNNDAANCVATFKATLANGLKGIYEASNITTIG